jgi:hypothetical protein
VIGAANGAIGEAEGDVLVVVYTDRGNVKRIIRRAGQPAPAPQDDAGPVRGRARVPVATLRNWEQGRNAIDPAARSLLMLVARDPEGTLAALAAARSAA